MRLLLLVVHTSTTLLLVAALADAFAPPATTGVPRATTSTTLYYRDDVPPIGSSPQWETPNDFPQFLTQCSIQSFLFLLKSLRDDHTLQWLHDFTDPVMLLQVNATTPTPTAVTVKPATKVKVSLAQAAQAALVNTDKALSKGGKLRKQPKVKDDNATASIETTVLSGKKKTKNKKDTGKASNAVLAKTKTRVNQNNKKAKRQVPGQTSFIKPPLAALKLLKDTAAIKTAFSHYIVGRYLAMARKNHVPVSNTDVTELYSTGIPTRQPRPVKVPLSFSPFAGKKVKSVPFAGFAGGLKQQQKVAATTTASSATASLYGPPPPKTNVTSDAAAQLEKGTTSSSVSYRTFPRSNPVALKYHGLAILNRTRFPTWESYFEQLLEQPKECFLVESYHGHIPTYEIDIDPASLVRRMLSVRMQIAQEFEHDLQVIADMGGLTLQSYQKMLREIREQRAETELQKQKDQLEKQMPRSLEDAIRERNGAAATDDVDNNSNNNNSDKPSSSSRFQPTVQRANLLFLDSSVGTQADYAPSPLRKGNFDLLCLLATQEAIHRVLNDASRKARRSPERGSNQFLQDFYVSRILSHFSGDQPWGRSDDFLEELLFCPPRMITIHGEDKKKKEGNQEDEGTKDLTYLVDPVEVAETILNKREKVALEWAVELTEQAKQDHMSLQRLILAKVMGGTIDECQIVDSDGQDMKDELGSCFE